MGEWIWKCYKHDNEETIKNWKKRITNKQFKYILFNFIHLLKVPNYEWQQGTPMKESSQINLYETTQFYATNSQMRPNECRSYSDDSIYRPIASVMLSLHYGNYNIKMSELSSKIGSIQQKYGLLKSANTQTQKAELASQLIIICTETQKLMKNEKNSHKTENWKRQIDQIKSKAYEIQEQYNKTKGQQNGAPENGSGSEEISLENKRSCSEEEMVYKISKTIAQQELLAKNMEINEEELQKITKQMMSNLQIINEINLMIKQNGQSLQQIQQKIVSTYQNTQQTSQQLQKAVDTQMSKRLMKIRMGLTGFFGALGFAILGIPGAIAGLFGGFKLSKSN